MVKAATASLSQKAKAAIASLGHIGRKQADEGHSDARIAEEDFVRMGGPRGVVPEGALGTQALEEPAAASP